MQKSADGNIPLVVDLDGTLLDSDILVESAFAFLRHNPWGIFLILKWLFHGRAYLKERLASAVHMDVHGLPYNSQVLDWLRGEKRAGRRLVLATATHEIYGLEIANHLGLFDQVFATNGTTNLSNSRKRDRLVAEFGEGGFEYVGNALADIPIWQAASKVHVANPERGVMFRLNGLNRTGKVFRSHPGYLNSLLKELRLHQWLKNVLIFVPLAAAHRFLDWELLADSALAFLLFGLCASSVYLLNDLIDLHDDRQHTSKRHRPLASGAFPIKHAVILVPTLLVTAFALALLFLPIEFAAVLASYYTITLGYSLYIKRIVLADVITLGLLYTTRIIAGGMAVELELTSWILAFSMFIFLSLAFVKRYAELFEVRARGKETSIRGRGYLQVDFELLASLGAASGYVAVLVFALYINEVSHRSLYSRPELLWLAVPLLLYWISRTWLLAHRGQMRDDPIVFAFEDATSRWVGLIFVLIFAFAT